MWKTHWVITPASTDTVIARYWILMHRKFVKLQYYPEWIDQLNFASQQPWLICMDKPGSKGTGCCANPAAQCHGNSEVQYQYQQRINTCPTAHQHMPNSHVSNSCFLCCVLRRERRQDQGNNTKKTNVFFLLGMIRKKHERSFTAWLVVCIIPSGKNTNNIDNNAKKKNPQRKQNKRHHHPTREQKWNQSTKLTCAVAGYEVRVRSTCFSTWRNSSKSRQLSLFMSATLNRLWGEEGAGSWRERERERERER